MPIQASLNHGRNETEQRAAYFTANNNCRQHFGTLIHLAEHGFGITYLPSFAVAPKIADGKLVAVLDDFTAEAGIFRVLWPTSRYLSPKIRVFVDFMADNLFAG